MNSMPSSGMAGGSASLWQMAMRLYARAMRAHRNRKAERALMEASDEMLKDIGISRSEIAGMVRLGAEDRTRRWR
jgi:uncharacterized protein YjiS (DUF1127 family)